MLFISNIVYGWALLSPEEKARFIKTKKRASFPRAPFCRRVAFHHSISALSIGIVYPEQERVVSRKRLGLTCSGTYYIVYLLDWMMGVI